MAAPGGIRHSKGGRTVALAGPQGVRPQQRANSRMSKMSLRVLFVIVLVAAAFTARTWIDWRSPAVSAAATASLAADTASGSGTHTVGSARDPVCGAAVNEAQAQAASRIATYQHETFYFCSHQCRRDFEEDPARFAPSPPAAAPPAARAP